MLAGAFPAYLESTKSSAPSGLELIAIVPISALRVGAAGVAVVGLGSGALVGWFVGCLTAAVPGFSSVPGLTTEASILVGTYFLSSGETSQWRSRCTFKRHQQCAVIFFMTLQKQTAFASTLLGILDSYEVQPSLISPNNASGATRMPSAIMVPTLRCASCP